MKKKMNRRTFGKLAAGAALAGAAAKEALAGTKMAQAAAASAPPQAAQDGAARPEPRVKMTPEQEEGVKQAVQRRERQLATLRNFKLDYSAEPAFVFKVRK